MASIETHPRDFSILIADDDEGCREVLRGLETLQLVRQMHSMLPGILVTADASQSLLREAQRSSVYSVLPKPVRKEMVLGTMARALRKHYGSSGFGHNG